MRRRVTALDEVLQLKPKENSFFKMSRNVTKLDVIFICEGKRDSEVLNKGCHIQML